MACSPSQANGDGNMYSSRHEHSLCSYKGLGPYECSGCKEYGANLGYKCRLCPDFILHEACAAIPDEYVHPLFTQLPLQFCSETRLRHHCDGCGEVIRGFVFESPSRDLRLHPLCLAIPNILIYGGRKDHRLKLLIDEKEKYSCAQCKKTKSRWKYQCEETACSLIVDLYCAKVDFHGLSDHGISSIARRSRSRHILEKLSKPGKFIAVHVLEGAVSGLVESAIN